MSNLLNRLESRKMPVQDVAVCLDMNLLDARDEAMADVKRAADAARVTTRVEDQRMVEAGPPQSPQLTAARKRVAAIEAQIKDVSITLRISGVDRFTFNQWILDCPARKGVDAGPYDVSKFYMHAARHSAVYVDEAGDEHEVTEEEWDAIDAKLTNGEYDRVARAVLHVNNESGRVDVTPFVSGSETTVDSFGISASRARSGSRRAASGAGSRPKSTSKKSTSKAAASSE